MKIRHKSNIDINDLKEKTNNARDRIEKEGRIPYKILVNHETMVDILTSDEVHDFHSSYSLRPEVLRDDGELMFGLPFLADKDMERYEFDILIRETL